MATIDLGKIKLVWRGTYAGGTAYTVDDVVQHTDSGLTSSFICTTASTGNAPSTSGTVHGSWAYLSKGGVAGTDVGTTITTQGDLLYRDGSGLQRLAKPGSTMYLQMTSGGVPSWSALSSDWVKVYGTDVASSMASYHDYNGHFTSTYRTYKIFVHTETDTSGNAWNVRCASTGSYTYDSAASYKWAFQWNSTTSSGVAQDAGDSAIRHGWNGSGSTATHVNTEITLYNPSDTTHGKHLQFQSVFWDNTSWGTSQGAGLWNNSTAAMTGIRIYGGGNTLVRYIHIYGLKA